MANPKTVIENYFKDIKLSDQEIAMSLGVSYGTVGRWRRGEKVPQKYHRDNLKKLAEGKTESTKTESSGDLMNKLNSLIEGMETLKAKCDMLNAKIDLLELRETQKKQKAG